VADDVATATKRPSAVQPWMVANVAMGAGFSAFIALLIPPYVTEVTSDATAAGVVMAVISLAAVLGPVLGTFADRHAAHRLVMSAGVLGLAIGFAAFALASESSDFFALDAIILGVSVAAVSAVGPVFIVGLGLSRDVEARRMTGYSLAMPAGQVLGGFLIGAAATAGWSYSARFWMASGCCLVLAVVTWFTSKRPEEELHRVMYAAADDGVITEKVAKVPLRKVLGSMFGLFLLISVLTSMANNGINSQISNIMPNVYGISEAETSTLISIAGALNMILFIPAGRLMSKRGTMPTYSLGVIMRLVGALGMAIVGLISGAPALLAVAFMQLLYQANPFARLAQPGTAVRFATFPAGMANGWLIAGSALGSFAGALLGGMLADAYGFNAVNWMGAAAAAGSIALLVLGLWPAKPVEPDRA